MYRAETTVTIRIRTGWAMILALAWLWPLLAGAGEAPPEDRTAAHEAAAAMACRAYAEAQDIYRRTDWNGDGVLEYAQSITGDFSLFERAAGQRNVQLVDQAFADASKGPDVGKPKDGYYFKLLKGEGDSAPGGKKTYLPDGKHMTAGYALLAYPAKHGVTGRRTFLMNASGTVYGKDLGEKTIEIARAMTEYNPDPTWRADEEAGVGPLPQVGVRPHLAQPTGPLDKALTEVALNPRDPYLQYVALQLARRQGRVGETAAQVDALTGANRNVAFVERAERRRSVNVFSLFTGALAVQESLQLETMRQDRVVAGAKADVDVAGLKGPEIKSHPWEKMLGGRQPELSVLCRCVPEDFYYAEFRTVNKLLDAMEITDLWGTHLVSQAAREARSQLVGEHLKQQLAIETSQLLRPVYDLIVEEVAVTGSDLYVREGSDVTLLFKIKQPQLFKARMDGFLEGAVKAHPDAVRGGGNMLGVAYEQVSTPDRAVNVFCAYPTPDLHVRSNSKAALERILAAIQGKEAAGQTFRRLGDTVEFSYARTLMPRGAPEEDGFVYLSDPFIRRLVGPQLKLTELHRMRCYNHLRMIGHAALLYRVEKGKAPEMLSELEKAQCTPGKFDEAELVCPDGGQYSLAADRATGSCTRHGNARFLTPCIEAPVIGVPSTEAEEYKAFLNDYNQYWRTYFDPIALRVQLSPKQYRVETIILPLMDNSIYTALARTMAGPPSALDSLPIPKRNIFSLSLALNRTALAAQLDDLGGRELRQALWKTEGIREETCRDLVEKGLDSQVGLHVYDAPPFFEFNLPGFLGEALGTFNRGFAANEALWISFFVSALNAPVYISIPVKDERVVDAFLEEADRVLAAVARRPPETGFIAVDHDYYTLEETKGFKVRGYALRFGPLKWRFFWARIGRGLYVASQKTVLDDLCVLEAARAKGQLDVPDAGPTAHAMVRVRAENWNQVLPAFRLAWAENNREACLNNLSSLSNVGQAWRAANAEARNAPDSDAERLRQGSQAQMIAAWLYGAYSFCPEGGQYLLAPDGQVTCNIHGSVRAPRQPAAPVENAGANELVRTLSGVTAVLTFQQDGLHAVVTVARKL